MTSPLGLHILYTQLICWAITFFVTMSICLPSLRYCTVGVVKINYSFSSVGGKTIFFGEGERFAGSDEAGPADNGGE